MSSGNDQRLELPDGHVLAEPGAPVERLYFIRRGQVAVSLPGAERVFRVGPGTILGLGAILDKTDPPVFQVHAKTFGPVTIEAMDFVETARQVAALLPRMRICLTAMHRLLRSVVENEEIAEKKIERLLGKSQRELDTYLAADIDLNEPGDDPDVTALIAATRPPSKPGRLA